ncbi:MAG: xanthine dehydrogenase small subunit [Polaromonas sp.]|nr:xanthine dehydrogenase small subunit [Polaromonas sp.]
MTTPNSQTIQFVRRGEVVTLDNVPPSRTLLEVLREDLGLTGTKEGCGEGDCGACTVVLGEANGNGEGEQLTFKAVNSCIRLAHSVHGLALWTVEDLSPANAGKPGNAASQHPAQEAMVQCHASQCGFCTPGFVMSLFGMYQKHVLNGQPITREIAQTELSGNLCRCTGYRPILDAAQQMTEYPAVRLDHPSITRQLAGIQPQAPDANNAYQLPGTLAELLAARAAQPKAQLVAGCTDVGLWVTKMHKQFDAVIDITRVAELRRIEQRSGDLVIGAAATLQDAFAALLQRWRELTTFAARFAGLPVRNSGTLGGNVANGSPIGDSMPLLIALKSRIVLASMRGEREMSLEDFYTGYRQNLLAADEVVAFIKVPPPTSSSQTSLLRAYKISKRYDDDISAVCLVLNLTLDGDVVSDISIGAGGVAATPVRARQTEAALRGQPWTLASVQAAMHTLRAEFEPISDMRASSSYRRQVLGNLLQRFWLESQGGQHINLEAFKLEAST